MNDPNTTYEYDVDRYFDPDGIVNVHSTESPFIVVGFDLHYLPVDVAKKLAALLCTVLNMSSEKKKEYLNIMYKRAEILREDSERLCDRKEALTEGEEWRRKKINQALHENYVEIEMLTLLQPFM